MKKTAFFLLTILIIYSISTFAFAKEAEYFGQKSFKDQNVEDEDVHILSNRIISDDNYKYDQKLYSIQSTSIDVTVDKTIINVGEDTPVTITVTSNGQPLQGEEVIIDGVSYGTTDLNGQITVSLHPYSHGKLPIEVGGYEYRNLLFAIYDDEGVVEVTGQDINGYDFESFYIYARSERMGWGDGTSGKVARTIAKQGANYLLFVHYGDNNEPGYYILKQINIIPGQVNQVQIDGSQAAAIDLNFTYNGGPIQYGDIYLETTEVGNGYFSNRIGSTNELGQKRVYVTPGTFNVSVKGYNEYNDLYYFVKRDVNMLGNNSLSYSWSDANTGKFQLNTSFDSSHVISREILINGSWVYLGDKNEIIMEQGTYELEEIGLKFDNTESWYYYQKPWGMEDAIIIESGTTNSHNLDLDLQEVALYIDNYVLEPGEMQYFELKPMTNSGYLISYISDGYAYMNVVMERPDGVNEDLGNLRWWDGEYFVSENAPEGLYTIHATADLGPIYGIHDIYEGFEVVGKPQLTVSNLIIPVGQDSQVTVRVTSNGQPLVNEEVIVEGYGPGYTDQNGELTLTLHPNHTEDIDFEVKGYEYEGLLFALDDDEGVVEISGDDINGQPISNFKIEVFSENMGWGRSSHDNTYARAVAKTGENQILLASRSYDGMEAYYLTKTVNVTPGQVNYIHFDGNNSVEVNMGFSYNNQLLQNTRVYLKGIQFTNEILNESYGEHYNAYMGRTDFSGNKKLRVTPGTYDVSVSENEAGSEVLYLLRNSLDMSTQQNFNVNWDSSNTGKLEVDFIAGANEPMDIFLEIYDNFIDLNEKRTLVLTPGQYTIDTIGFWLAQSRIEYNYRKPWDGREVVDVAAGQIIDFSKDLRITGTVLKLSSTQVFSGSYLDFELAINTYSGYEIEGIYSDSSNDYESMHAQLTKPSGENIDLGYFEYDEGYVYMDSSYEDGMYTLTATRDLGPLYGTQTAVQTFEVLLPDDSYEPDNSSTAAANITTDGTVQTHYIVPAGDVDWVQFQAQAGETYVISTSNLSQEMDTYIYLYDIDGATIIAENDDYEGLASQITWTAPVTGTYYIKIRHFDELGAGRYDVSIIKAASGNNNAFLSDVTAGDAAYRDIVKVLLLDIMEKNIDGAFRPDDFITRAEFARNVVVLAGLQSQVEPMSNISVFSDVSIDNKYNGWINVAASEGFLKGNPDGTVNPDGSISMAEVLTVLLRILGYNDNLPGGWPTDYITKATSLGITDNLTFSGTDPATRRVVAQLISRVLTQDIVIYDNEIGDFVNDPNQSSLLDENFNGVLLVKLAEIANAYGLRSGNDNWNSEFDLIPNNIIDIYDMVFLAQMLTR